MHSPKAQIMLDESTPAEAPKRIRTIGHDLRTAAVRLASGTAVGQAAVVLASPVISRLYAPTEIGAFGLVVSFVGFASVFVGLRLELAIIDADSETEADNLLRLALLATVPLSAIAAALVLVMRAQNWLAFGQLPALIPVATFVLLVVTGAFLALRFWHVRQRGFTDIGAAVAGQGIGRALLPAAFGLLPGVGVFGLIAGEIGGRSIGIWRLGRSAWPRLIAAGSLHAAEHFGRALWRHRRVPLMLLPSSGIDALAAALPLPLIAQLFGLQVAGEFALVQRIASAPAALLATSVADVFHARLSARHVEDDAGALIASTARLLLLVSVAIYLPVAILSPWLFGIVFGARWAHAGWVLVALAPLLAASLVVSPLSRALMFAARLDLKLAGDAVWLVVPLGALFLSARAGATAAIAAYAAGGVLAQLVYFLMIRRAVS
jgi:O-antigen/teichoic acid export membrane protein